MPWKSWQEMHGVPVDHTAHLATHHIVLQYFVHYYQYINNKEEEEEECCSLCRVATRTPGWIF